jgi:hypothetical protein
LFSSVISILHVGVSGAAAGDHRTGRPSSGAFQVGASSHAVDWPFK